jgi:hypothetical protein
MMRHCQRDDIVLTCEADITHGLLQLFLPPGYRYIGLIFLLLRLSLNNTPDCSPVIISMLCHVMSCHVIATSPLVCATVPFGSPEEAAPSVFDTKLWQPGQL